MTRQLKGSGAMRGLRSQPDFKALRVSSTAFGENNMIPGKYAHKGEDVSPPIEIGEIPATARSLVLMVEDVDAPQGSWLHWLVYNAPVMRHIGEGEIPGDMGVNDFGRVEYEGPCPPYGTHHYHFRVYALDDLMDLPRGASRREVEEAMREHIVAFGETVGKYRFKKIRQDGI